MGPLSVSIFPGNIISQDSGWRCIMIIDFLQWNHSLRSKGVQQEFSLFLCAMRNHMSRCPDRQKLWLKSPPHKTRWGCGSAFSIFEQSNWLGKFLILNVLSILKKSEKLGQALAESRRWKTGADELNITWNMYSKIWILCYSNKKLRAYLNSRWTKLQQFCRIGPIWQIWFELKILPHSCLV